MSSTLPTAPGSTRFSLLHRFWPLLALVPVGVLTAALAGYATDFPRGYDDVGTAASLLRFLDAPTLTDRWAALLEQNNEHRVLFLRMFVAGWYGLTGQYSHVTFALASCLCLTGIAALFYPVVRAMNLPGRAFLPVPFLLLALNQMDNQFSVFGLQNFGVVLWALLFFYFLTIAPSPWVYPAAALTALSSGNGLLFVGIGLFILAYQRRWRHAFGLGLLTVLLTGLYFRNLALPPSAGRDWSLIGRNWYRNLGDFAAMSAEWHTFVNPLRSAVFLFGWVVLFMLLGFVVQRVLRRKAAPADLFLTAVLGMGLGSGLLVSVLRAEDSPLMAGRYKIYSALFLVVVYLWSLDALRVRFHLDRLLLLATVGSAGWFGLVTFKYWPDLRFHRDQTLAYALTWRQPRHPWHETLMRERAVLRNGRDAPHVLEMERALAAPLNGPSPVTIDRLEDNGSTLVIYNDRFRRGEGPDDGVFTVVRSPDYTAVFPVRYLSSRGKSRDGFTAQVARRFLFRGEYRLGFLICQAGRCSYAPSDQKLLAPASLLDRGLLP